MIPTPARRSLSAVLPLLGALGACSTDVPRQARAPVWDAVPPTRMSDVVDDYHGTAVADPYRWLEDQDGAETAAWVEQQSAVTEAFLATLPWREDLRRRLRQLWDHERHDPPRRYGDWWIYRKNDGLQDQAVLYRTRSPGVPGEVLLDPNALSEDGTVSVGAAVGSRDGQLLAYSLSHAGSDWMEWRVLETATGATRPDVVRWSKFGGAAWAPDGAGFFYTRFPEPAAGETYEAVNERPQLCYHRLGTEQADDEIVYERPDQPRWGFAAGTTEDGRYLVIRISEGTDRRNRVAYLDLEQQEAGVRPLLMDFDAEYDFAGSEGARFFFRTDKDAPRRRLIALDLARPAPEHWTVVVPQTAHTLSDARLVAGRWLCTYTVDAHHELRVHAPDGALEREVALPDIGSVRGLSGRPDDRRAYLSFSSFTVPDTVYACDPATGELAVWRRPDLDFDAGAFVTRQVFFQSTGGARIPMFVVHRRGLQLDGSHPTLLYGYGGFDISLLPRFSVQNAVWLERGGIYAQPTLRGGGEYGEEWHRAGMLENKQNVFDDFLGAAEYLVRNDYTRPAKLGIRGGSNGGLLVGACLTQRPDLFGAALPEVGVMDMLRYHRFTIGWAWIPEYGSSDDPQQFKTLHAYSPLHRIRQGTAYPATLVMTGDHDDRVLPGHSYKFAAALQRAQAGPEPVLIRIETRAGHGARTPTSKQVAAAADRLAFLTWALRAR